MNRRVLELHNHVFMRELEGKTILITGSTGLIGSNIVFYLVGLNDKQKANITIVALYRNEQKRDRVFSALLGRRDIIFIKGNIEENIPYEYDVDFIIHGAGFSGGMKMHLKAPVRMFETGIYGTKTVLDFAIRHDCKGFLYLSSYEVYGDNSSEGLIDEKQNCQLDAFSLRGLHANIKLACESLLRIYSFQYGLPVYCARLTSTFGKGVQYDDPRFFAEFGRCILEEKDIVLKTSGKTVRSYLDAEDAAAALLYILARGENCNVYNVTNMENEISIRDMALKMIEVTQVPIQLVVEKENAAVPLGFRKEGRTVMDASKLYSLGWRPVHTLEETIFSLIYSMRNEKCFNENGGDVKC